MLPTVGTDTTKIIWYTAEVAGRALGVASVPNLIPDKARRDALEASGNAIAASLQGLTKAYVARVLYEYVDYRLAIGKGRGIDRGFDATVSTISETIRTSLPDRLVSNPEYRAIFPDGAEEYTSPTIREDEQLATDLRQAVDQSKLTVKGEVIALLDVILPLVGPAATALRDSEKQVNSLFLAEQAARKEVIDTLWQERKNIEAALGRGGRGLSRFVVFDFRSPGEDDSAKKEPAAPAKPADPAPAKPGGAVATPAQPAKPPTDGAPAPAQPAKPPADGAPAGGAPAPSPTPAAPVGPAPK